MNITDVLVGEVFEWKGARYKVAFLNPNCVQANKQHRTCYSKNYTLVPNDADVALTNAAMGRDHLVTA